MKILGGILELKVEIGRRHNIEYNQRTCDFCNDIEDEYHFLFTFPA